MRRLIHLATVLVCLPILYVAAAMIGAVWPGTHNDLPPGNAVRVGLVRGAIHYDLLLPLTDDLRAQYRFAEAAGVPVTNPQAKWLVVGWGAKGFYTTVGRYGDVTAQAVWRAITGDEAVMHLDVVGPVHPIPGLVFLSLSDPQYQALLTGIDAGFQRDQTGAAVPLQAPGLDRNDAFYAARGDFNLFHTCNDWIGETLRAAGVPFGAWTPTPQSVSVSANWFTPAQS